MNKIIMRITNIIKLRFLCLVLQCYSFIILFNKIMEDVTIEVAKEMRAKYFPIQSVEEYKGHNNYLSYLASKGAALNPKLFPSVFHLKNGLSYIGMAVKQTVQGGQVLIRIPQELILSSAKAVQQPCLKQVFKDHFFTKDELIWQDRVLIVYSLFILDRQDEKNPWFQMINQFPKQCDIACFWSEAQLEEFKDKTIKSAAEVDLKSFQTQWGQFQSIRNNYQILKGEYYNKDNYRTIYIHLANRSFGKYISYLSFVPMAQLFNHHCSKVFYTVQKQPSNAFVQLNQTQKQQTSSVGSGRSNQYIYQGEFDYNQSWTMPFQEKMQQSSDLIQLQKQGVKGEFDKLLDKVQRELNWSDFSVIFAAHLLYLAKFIYKEYLKGQKSFQKTLNEFITINNTVQYYKKNIQMFSQRVNKKIYRAAKEQHKKKQSFEYPLYQKQYQSLILKTTPFDKTQPNNQIYFRYGLQSNRELLMNYGFAIEGNKYENFKLSFNISQIIGDYPGMMHKVVEKKLSLERRFKLYNHRLNIDLIIFFRLSNWTFYGQKAVDEIFWVVNLQKEIAILQQIVSILKQNVQVYQGDYDLTDKSLNYHQYFTRVYHKEKLTILKKQIKLFGLIIDILQKISEGVSKDEASQGLTNSQKTIIKQYLESIL